MFIIGLYDIKLIYGIFVDLILVGGEVSNCYYEEFF